jgi:hypothetical protein
MVGSRERHHHSDNKGASEHSKASRFARQLIVARCSQLLAASVALQWKPNSSTICSCGGDGCAGDAQRRVALTLCVALALCSKQLNSHAPS